MKTNKNVKANRNGMTARVVLSLICFTAYIALFVVATANSFNTNLYSFLLS